MWTIFFPSSMWSGKYKDKGTHINFNNHLGVKTQTHMMALLAMKMPVVYPLPEGIYLSPSFLMIPIII